MSTISSLYAESLLFQSPHPSQLPYPVFRSNVHYSLVLFLHSSGDYSIHGLWPEAVQRVQYCDGIYDESQLISILDQLQAYWYSFDHNSRDFWKHEYIKHGTCTNLTELQYFKKVLELFHRAIHKGPTWLQKWTQKNTVIIPVSQDWSFVDSVTF